MLASIVHTVRLTRHPESSGAAVHAIEARVRRTPGGALALGYVLEGELARVNLPPPRLRRFSEGLWRRTCCECFIRIPDGPGYHEFNFSPSGEWAAYAFTKYREGAPLADEMLNPRINVHRRTDRLDLEAVVALDRLAPEYMNGRLALALSAVIEEDDGALSHWALAHAPGAPDFHHPAAFALALA
jgi:hypothetical protein